MKLNQTPNPLDRDARNKENENWDKIEDSIKGIKNEVDDFVGTVSDEVIEELIDNAKLNWREFVDSYDDLPSDAKSGDTVLTRDDGKVYRYNGNEWVEIQQIDINAIDVIEQKLDEKFSEKYDEVESRLADTDSSLYFTRRGVSSVSPSFVIVDDDIKTEAYTILKSIFDQKGIKGSFAAITGKIGDSGYLTESQLMDLHNDGHDIISHTVTHADLTTLADSALDAELKDSKQYLNSLGIEAKHIMYPFGRNNAKVRRYTKRYYESAGTTPNYVRVNKRPLKTYQVGRLGVGVYGAELEQELESFIPYIEDAIENNLMCIFMTHIAETPSNKIHVIEDVIDYVHSRGYDFETYSEAYEKHKNTLDYGDEDFAIGALGELGIPDLSVYTAPHDSYTNADAPKKFKERTLTINVVRDNASAGLPENRGGVLETYRLSNDDLFTFQRFRVRNTKNVYGRTSSGDGVWGSWEGLSAFERLSPNSVDGNSPNTDFPAQKSSFVFIQDKYSNGFPEDVGGLLFTYIGTSNKDYTYQEYVPRKSNRKYNRYWDGNKWGDWSFLGGVGLFGYEEFGLNTDISEFPIGMSYTMIRDVNANGFPENKGGTLITYRMSDDDFCYQEYKLAKSNRKFIRTYVNGNFTTFKEITIE